MRGVRCLCVCAFRNSSSIRHIPFTKPSLSSEPVPAGSHSILHEQSVRCCEDVIYNDMTHHITRNVALSNRESFQIARTTSPSSLSSGPTFSSMEVGREAAAEPFEVISSGFVIKSTESPLQPAACRALGFDDFARSIWREAITLDQGEVLISPNKHRPVEGKRSHYRVNVRHGVSPLRSGEHYALGVIFHDAE